MNFDAFDAPQFVDFSEENFDLAGEGDSWFSSDSSRSFQDFQVEELPISDDDDEDDGPSFVCPGSEIPTTTAMTAKRDVAKLPERIDLPSWARVGALATKVVTGGGEHEAPPPTLAATSLLASTQAPLPVAPSSSSSSSGPMPTATASARPIARWRRAVKRASLEHQRRQSVGGAKAKVAQKAKEKIRTPTKNKQAYEQQLAKRIKTGEKPKRGDYLNRTYAAVPTTSRPPIKSTLTGSASERVNSSASAETGPSLQGRKRLRVPDSGVEIETNASEQRMVQFSTKTASGTKQTFHFTSSSRPGASDPNTFGDGAGDPVRFHGRQATTVTSDGLRPKSGRRNRTEFKEFHFHTEDRAQARNQLNVAKAQNLARLRVIEERRRREAEAKERQELRRFREALVHKPTPVPHAIPFIVSASAKRLTSPESPNLSYKQLSNKRES